MTSKNSSSQALPVDDNSDFNQMIIWHLLIGTRGGQNRMEILRSINQQPRNANQIAKNLDLDYKTVRHHLGVLQENNIVKDSGQDYGAVYCPTKQARDNWDVIERVIDSIESGV